MQNPPRSGAVSAPFEAVSTPLGGTSHATTNRIETPERGGETPPLQEDSPCRGAVSAPSATVSAPFEAQNSPTTIARPTLGKIVAYYKYQTTKQINEMRGAPGGRFWQRNFHDTIIRNQRQLDALRQYIDQNPARWALDTENPDRPGSGADSLKPSISTNWIE